MAGAESFRVSVCLLTYNHMHSLEAVLNSVLAQTYADLELIVSDDCSTDGTWNLLRSYAARERRIRLIRTPRNLGMAGNANHAIRQAEGEFIALLHHDDILAPTLIERWVAVVRQADNIGFVFNDYEVNGSAASHASSGLRFAEVTQGQAFLRDYLLSGWGCPVRGTALIRKGHFNEVGGFQERFGLLADIDLWMRLAARWNVGYVSDPLMKVLHEPNDDYPAEYRAFSWKRMRLLFDIHAANRNITSFGTETLFGCAGSAYRIKVSAEATKWLVYSVVRRKWAMATAALEGANHYEYALVNWLRGLVSKLGRAMSATK